MAKRKEIKEIIRHELITQGTRLHRNYVTGGLKRSPQRKPKVITIAKLECSHVKRIKGEKKRGEMVLCDKC